MKATRTQTAKRAERLAAEIEGDEGAKALAQYLAERLSAPIERILDKVPGKSVIEKSRAAGVSRQSFYAWMKGETRPSEAQAKVLARLTGFSIAEIRGTSLAHAPTLPRVATLPPARAPRRRERNRDNLPT